MLILVAVNLLKAFPVLYILHTFYMTIIIMFNVYNI